MSNKQDIINKVLAHMEKQEPLKIEQEPIGNFKKNALNNIQKGDDTNQLSALMRYNIFIDSIKIGTGTHTDIEYAGVNWRLRLLSAEERIAIQRDVDKEMQNITALAEFEVIYKNYLFITKTLTKALTPHQFTGKGEGTAGLNEDDLKQLPTELLTQLYELYCDFVEQATKKVTQMTNEEVVLLYQTVKKNPSVLKDLNRRELLTVSHYTLALSLSLQDIIENSKTNERID